jgi:hypothetical protein
MMMMMMMMNKMMMKKKRMDQCQKGYLLQSYQVQKRHFRPTKCYAISGTITAQPADTLIDYQRHPRWSVPCSLPGFEADLKK